MLPNSVVATVGSTDYTFTKISEQNGATTYVGEFTGGANNDLRKMKLEVKHTLPADINAKQSHLAKLGIDIMKDGAYFRTVTSHNVTTQSDGAGANSWRLDTRDILEAFMNVSAVRDALEQASY